MLAGIIDEAAKEWQVTVFQLLSNVNNTKGNRLYESEGFSNTGKTIVVPKIRHSGRIELDQRSLFVKTDMESDLQEQDNPLVIHRAAIVYPNGNTTAVVFDQLLETGDEERKQLQHGLESAWKDIDPAGSEIEQSCFVTLPKDKECIARVEMFGGEFCGNATRSVIWLLTEGKDYEGKIEVSGTDKPLEFSVKSGVVTVEMPLPKDEELVQEVAEGQLVKLDGISHVVVSGDDLQKKLSPRELLSELLTENKYGLANEPAVGVTYYDKQSKHAQFCVWVSSIDETFDETACGSGTCAIGIALARALRSGGTIDVIQPSGESIRTFSDVDEEGNVTKSTIAGTVSVLYDGGIKIAQLYVTGKYKKG